MYHKNDWLRIFDQQEKSGLSISAYCRANNISGSAFHNARKRYESDMDAACRLVPVVVEDDPETIDVVVNGLEIRIGPSVSDAALQKLLSACKNI